MRIPYSMMMDVLDPYPLVFRRPQPPEPKSQADIWFDQEFEALREKKENPRLVGETFSEWHKRVHPEHYQSPSRQSMAESMTRDMEIQMKQQRAYERMAGVAIPQTPIKEHSEKEWLTSPPGIPGDYIASLHDNADWVRHWNGAVWSQAWHVNREHAEKLAKKNPKRTPPFREHKWGQKAPNQAVRWLPGRI